MRRLVIYLAVTFGLTWGLLIVAGMLLGTFENGENSSMAMIGLIAASMFFPLVGALVANFACKPEERIDLCLKPLIKRNVRHYLVAWLAPSIIALLGCAVFFALNPQWFDPSMASYLESMQTATASAGQPAIQVEQMPLVMAATIVSSILVAPFINMIPAFGEEVGWRSMLFPTLAELMPQRAAALVSGAIWGLWHAPAIAMGHNYGMNYAGFPFAGILTMMLACTAMGCWLAFLRLRSKSVWPCALAHGAFNAVANMGLVFSSCGPTLLGPSPLGPVAGIPLIVLGIICLVSLSPSRKIESA